MVEYAKENEKKCYIFHRVGQPSRRDELLLHPIRSLEAFGKWVFDFVGRIKPPMRHSHAIYIITTTYYLTCWEEATLVKYCTTHTKARFIFESIHTKFGCPRILTSDQGSHLINDVFFSLLQNFTIHHHKRNPYHS